MKFKKAFAWILAVAMVITLMPSMAFATSVNSVPKTYTVSSDDKMPIVSLDLKVTNSDGLPGGEVQKVRLNLENAEWNVENLNDTTTFVKNNPGMGFSNNPDSTTDGGILVQSAAWGVSTFSNFNGSVEVSSLDDDTVTISLTPTPGNPITQDSTIRISLGLRAGSESGPVNVTVDQDNSRFTSGTYTVATVSGNTTITNVTGKVKSFPRQEVTASDVATVEIKETAVSSITTDQILKLTLPKGYNWTGLNITGDLVAPDTDNKIQATDNNGNPLFEADGTTPKMIQSYYYAFGSSATAATSDTYNTPEKLKGATKTGTYCKTDERTVYVYINTADDPGYTEEITLKPQFNITKEASMGDVTLTVAGHWADSGKNKVATASGLVIAKYGDESVTISTVAEENLPQIISGFKTDKDDNFFVAKIILEENTKGSLSAGRYIDFDFNDDAQILVDAPIQYYVGKSTTVGYNDSIVGTSNLIDQNSAADDVKKDCSEFTLTVPRNGELTNWDSSKPNRLVLLVPITVKADYTGDITCKVSGAKAGIEETELVVAKAIPVFSVETEVTKIVNGAQNQATANIKITENVSGYIEKDDLIKLQIDTAGLDPDSFAFDSAKGSVTNGDLEIKEKIGKVASSRNSDAKNALAITINDSSTSASTIELTDIIINMARNLPEGEYKLNAILSDKNEGTAAAVVGGIENPEYLDGDFGRSVVKTAYVNNMTIADSDVNVATKINAVFTLRQDTFTNNGETVQMDTAPYLDANNRTQLPIRYAAIACGVNENDISWNQASQTATINAGNKVLRITIGSNIMQTSDGIVTMDTAAVSSNGRIFVPIRYIANALGANVAWDQDAKTITLTN